MDGLITTGVYTDVEIVKKKSQIPDPAGSTVPLRGNEAVYWVARGH